MKTYSEKLKDPRWQKKRLEIMQRDKFMCQCCGDAESTLNVHHIIYFYGKDIWDYENDLLITFCEDCHNKTTEIKKDVKYKIDTKFIHPEYLDELNEIIKMLQYFNPYDLMMVRKNIEKYCKQRVKNLHKINHPF